MADVLGCPEAHAVHPCEDARSEAREGRLAEGGLIKGRAVLAAQQHNKCVMTNPLYRGITWWFQVRAIQCSGVRFTCLIDTVATLVIIYLCTRHRHKPSRSTSTSRLALAALSAAFSLRMWTCLPADCVVQIPRMRMPGMIRIRQLLGVFVVCVICVLLAYSRAYTRHTNGHPSETNFVVAHMPSPQKPAFATFRFS